MRVRAEPNCACASGFATCEINIALLRASRQLARKLELSVTAPNRCTRTGAESGQFPPMLSAIINDIAPASLAFFSAAKQACGFLSRRRSLYLAMKLGGSVTCNGVKGLYCVGNT